MSTTDEYVNPAPALIHLHPDGTATTHPFVVEWEMTDDRPGTALTPSRPGGVPEQP